LKNITQSHLSSLAKQNKALKTMVISLKVGSYSSSTAAATSHAAQSRRVRLLKFQLPPSRFPAIIKEL